MAHAHLPNSLFTISIVTRPVPSRPIPSPLISSQHFSKFEERAEGVEAGEGPIPSICPSVHLFFYYYRQRCHRSPVAVTTGTAAAAAANAVLETDNMKFLSEIYEELRAHHSLRPTASKQQTAKQISPEGKQTKYRNDDTELKPEVILVQYETK